MKPSYAIKATFQFILLIFFASNLVARVEEGRALWVLRYTLLSKMEIDRALDMAHRGGFNTLFVQVSGRADAYFPSETYPLAEKYLAANLNFDPLAYIIEKAHEREIEVHTWINTLFAWSAPSKPENLNHVVWSHPEWILDDERGRSYADYSFNERSRRGITGAFLSPGNPEVRTFIRTFILEIINKYPVDGVHLDYIRYPNLNFVVDEAARKSFTEAHGFDPILFKNKRSKVVGEIGAVKGFELERNWQAWCEKQVTDLVKLIREDILHKRPEVILSAAVVPDLDTARREHGQDWILWTNSGLVDIVVPMAYFKSKSKVIHHVEKIKKEVKRGHIYVGLSTFNQPASGIIDKVKAVRRLGVDGFSVFSYNNAVKRSNYIDDIGRYSFADSAAVPKPERLFSEKVASE